MSLELLRQKVKEKCENNPHLDFKPVDKIPNTKLHSYIKEVVKNSLKKRYNIFIQELLNEKDTISFRESFLSSAYINLFSTDTVIGEKLEERFEKCIPLGERVTKNLIDGEDINDRSIDFFAVFADYKGGQDFLNECLSGEYLASRNQGDKKNQVIIIPGAEIINETFFERIEQERKISRLEVSEISFYTGKQDKAFQWLGVLNNFDVKRHFYSELKEHTLKCFTKHRTNKIVAVVYGSAGVGKSTILRRLAIDCQKEMKHIENYSGHKILWVNSFNEFFQDGLAKIENENRTQFLIVIEDWDSLVERRKNKPDAVKDFLLHVEEIPNVRFVIGDRHIQGREYLNDLIGGLVEGKTIFSITSRENKEIINEIVIRHPHLRRTTRLFSNIEGHYNSSLFLLLFVLVNRQSMKVDLEEPKTEFIKITAEDLSNMAEKNLGCAKALFFWSCYYREFKTLLSYNTFKKIVNMYNGSLSGDEDELGNFDLNSPTHNLLKNYVHQDREGILNFNHNLLAEEGLSKTNLFEWNDVVKRKLVNFIVLHGDEYSASIFLGSTIEIQPILFSKNEQIELVDHLLSKKNIHNYYLSRITELSSDETKLDYYRKLIVEKEAFNSNFVKVYLTKRPSDEGIKEQFDAYSNFSKVLTSTLNNLLKAMLPLYVTHPYWKKLSREEKRNLWKGPKDELYAYLRELSRQVDRDVFGITDSDLENAPNDDKTV